MDFSAIKQRIVAGARSRSADDPNDASAAMTSPDHRGSSQLVLVDEEDIKLSLAHGVGPDDQKLAEYFARQGYSRTHVHVFRLGWITRDTARCIRSPNGRTVNFVVHECARRIYATKVDRAVDGATVGLVKALRPTHIVLMVGERDVTSSVQMIRSRTIVPVPRITILCVVPSASRVPLGGADSTAVIGHHLLTVRSAGGAQ